MTSIKITFSRLSARRWVILGAFWLLAALSTEAQAQDDIIYKVAQQAPTPEGGLSAFYEYTEDNLVRPAEAVKKNVKGSVFVQFVVEKTGELSQIKIVKGLGYGCDEAVVNCLKTAPRWKPGKNAGKPIRVQQMLAIQIK